MVADRRAGIVVRYGRYAAEQVLQRAMPVTDSGWKRTRRNNRRVVQMRLKRSDPGIAVGKRLFMRQWCKPIELQVVVRVDQAWQDQMVSEIERKRARFRPRSDALSA